MDQEPVRRIHLREFKAISRALSTYEDLNMLINHIVERICKSFEVKGCGILLLDEREKQLFRVASFGMSNEYVNKGPVVIKEQHSAFFMKQPVFIENFQDDPRVQYPEAAAREGIVSMLSVLIKCHGAAIGILRIYHSEIWVLHEEDLDSFCLLAEHLGLVIECNGLRNFLDKLKAAMGTLPLRMLEGI